MGWTGSTFAVVVLGGGVLAAVVGLATLRKRPDPLALPLAVMLFAVTAWAVPHAVSLGYTDVGRVAFWHRLRYPGTVVAPVAYLVVAVRYAGYEQWLTRRTYALLAVVPGLTLVAVWTNPVHGLFWRSVTVARVGDAAVLVPTYGPWYWANLGYLYLTTVVGLLLLAEVAVRSGPLYRKQAGLVFLGGLVPLATNVAVTLGVGPDPMVDLTTTALAVTGLLMALALFYFDLLAVRPVARDRLVAELDDGVVVVGPDGRIRDFNPTAKRVLGDVAIDQPAEAVLPSDVVPDGGELVVETDDGTRTFRTRSTTLIDGRGRETGRIVYLNDVTEIVGREQRISVLNRVLRHNVRNELNVATGHLDVLTERTSGENRERVETALASTRRVVEFAEKARDVERTIRAGDARTTVSAAAVVRRVVEEARAAFPDATVDYDPPSSDGATADPSGPRTPRVRIADAELFETAVTELVENAVVHSDLATPHVAVGVESDGDRVHVRVADDGPGIPAAEREVLTAPTETQLEHGSGLGLWLVTWLASLSAGELTFAESDPRGSVVTLTLPAG